VAATFFALAVAGSQGSCPGSTDNSIVCTGDVTITTSQEFDAFVARGCTSVSGTLTISGTDLTSVSLPLLTSVYSLVIEGNTALLSVSLASLATETSVRSCPTRGSPCEGGLSIHGNPALDAMSLPALRDAGTVEVSANQALRSLSLTAFTSGRLEISGAALTSISLPVLSTGSVLVEGTALTSLGLPKLTTGSAYFASTRALASVSLPSLTSGAVRFQVAPSLASLSLPVLTTGAIDEYDRGHYLEAGVMLENTALTSLSLPMLVAGSVYVFDAPVASLSLPVLAAGKVHVDATSALTSLNLPELATGSVSVQHTAGLTEVKMPAMTNTDDLVIFNNTSLTSLSVPTLHGAFNVDIEGNSLLTTVSMPELRAVGNRIWISDNPTFPQCQAEAILAQLTAVPPTVTISGNDTTATCPP